MIYSQWIIESACSLWGARTFCKYLLRSVLSAALVLEGERFLDHVDRIEELPTEELDELRNELTVLSDHHACLVRVAAYVAV